MRMYYAILHKCPFPGHWEPLPLYLIQRAELGLRMNRTHYYERARRTPQGLYTYQQTDAERIAAYLQAQHPYMDVMLIGSPTPFNASDSAV